MKATGIVRRIDARVIITPKYSAFKKQLVFAYCSYDFCQIHTKRTMN